MADILRSLNACPEWSVVIAAFTDHCIQQLPHTLKRTNLFTLLVLVGFPEVRPAERNARAFPTPLSVYHGLYGCVCMAVSVLPD